MVLGPLISVMSAASCLHARGCGCVRVCVYVEVGVQACLSVLA